MCVHACVHVRAYVCVYVCMRLSHVCTCTQCLCGSQGTYSGVGPKASFRVFLNQGLSFS